VRFPELLELIDDLFDAYCALRTSRVLDITLPCFRDTAVYSKWKDTLTIRLHSCAAAQYALKVTCDGRVSACICQEQEPFIIGDLRKDSLDAIWASEKTVNFGPGIRKFLNAASVRREMFAGRVPE